MTATAPLRAPYAAIAAPRPIGFPAATDFDYTDLAPTLARRLLNNVGDPTIDGISPGHTKAIERQVVAAVASMFRAPATRWGYVTTGSSEGNLWALREARRRLPFAAVYRTTAAHYSVPKAIDILGLADIVVATDPRDEMDYDDLRQRLRQRLTEPVIVVANAGTTMTEAIDDLHRITTILDELDIPNRYIHVDAALSGPALATLKPGQRPGYDLADGADSIVTSGHKFLGSPMPCGIIIARTPPTNHHRIGVGAGIPQVPYIGSPDTTITGSRNGHTPVILHTALHRHGRTGLRTRAQHARELAAYTVDQLTAAGWPAWRHPHAFTVVLDRQIPTTTARRWSIPSENGRSHIICMPGITHADIDAFTTELAATPPHPPAPRQRILDDTNTAVHP